MIEIIGPALVQWDVGRVVRIDGIEADSVHLANKGDSRAVIMEIVDGQAKIPDYLLQTGKPLCVYAVKDGVTIETRFFSVRNRERPENYVYEDDQRNYIYELIANAENAIRELESAMENGDFVGPPGPAGTSVTITHIAESDGDGAINMVAFSDGKTMTIKNGRKGSPGITPHIGENGNWWIGETDTGVSAGGSGGSGGPAIVDVTELPTGEFDKSVFYRTNIFSLYVPSDEANGTIELADSMFLEVVETLPDVGQVYDDKMRMLIYYEVSTEKAYIWQESGWVDVTGDIDFITTLRGYVATGKPVILIHSGVFYYRDRWIEVESVSDKVVIAHLDYNNLVCSMTSEEIKEAIRNGKIVVAESGSNSVLLRICSNGTAEGILIEAGSGTEMAVATTIKIYDDGKFSYSTNNAMVPNPSFGSQAYGGDTGKVLSVGGTSLQWVDPSTLPGGGGSGGESNTVFVTADLSTMTASMTGTEIEEAIDSGKVAVLLNAKTNAVMCTLKPMTSEETAEGRRAAVMGTMLESLGGGLKEDVLNGNASWNNVISAAILIDPEGNISMGDTFCMLPPPAPEDTNKIPMIVSGDSDGIKWVDPATMPSLKGEPGESVTITHIAESDGDGAINMVAFSDGKTMTIKNGSKGSPGITPHIGENGNWWVGETDTGVSASGGGVTVEDVLAALPKWTGGSY